MGSDPYLNIQYNWNGTYIITCILIFFFGELPFGMAQEQDTVKVHTNQSQYFAGDTVWSSCYVLQDGKVTLDEGIKVVQYVLLSSDKKQVLEAKVRIAKGKGRGYFLINNKVKSGIYTLYAFVPFENNGKKKATCIPIVIYNLEDYKQFANGINTTAHPVLRQDVHKNISLVIENQSGVDWQAKLTDRLGDGVSAIFSVAIIDSSLLQNLGAIDTIAEVQDLNAYHKRGKGLQISGELNFHGKVPAELNTVLLRDIGNNNFVHHQILGNTYPKFSFSNLDIESERTLLLELKMSYDRAVEFKIQEDSFDFGFVYTTMPSVDI
ncbi:MAG TPA: hypothetical protein VF691_10390 [Cytophagaceae bacterium]|jgi:hypothetical protein